MNPGSMATISSSTSTYQISNVHIGDVLVDFAQPVITGTSTINGSTMYGLLDCDGGFYKLNLIPVKQ